MVATKEKKGVYFTTVPHKWEASQLLYWPEQMKHSDRERLRANAGSSPEEDWSTFPCIVKLKNIFSFEEGLKLEKQLTDCSDTEAEERKHLLSTYAILILTNRKFLDCLITLERRKKVQYKTETAYLQTAAKKLIFYHQKYCHHQSLYLYTIIHLMIFQIHFCLIREITL